MQQRSDSSATGAGTRWLKVDFHLHAAEDPSDEVMHSAFDLLHMAHRRGFDALAITLHDHVLARPELDEAARELGLLLIPAAEMRLEGSDVVILNLNEQEAESLESFADLEKLRSLRGSSIFVFAPHPFYVLGGSIGRRLRRYIDCFDAIEYCHFHTRWLNLNRPAVKLAAHYSKPLLATSDTHRLDFFGEHYSLVQTDEPPTAESLFRAIRAGNVRCVSPALSVPKFLDCLFYITITHALLRLPYRF